MGTSTRGQLISKQNQTDQNSNNCYCCNKTGHFVRECRFKYLSCKYCKTEVHLISTCYKLRESNLVRYVVEVNFENKSETSQEIFYFILDKKVKADPMELKVKIRDSQIIVEVDTGSYITVVAEPVREKYFADWPVSGADKEFKYYDGSKIKPKLMLKQIPVELKNREQLLDVYMIRDVRPVKSSE